MSNYVSLKNLHANVYLSEISGTITFNGEFGCLIISKSIYCNYLHLDFPSKSSSENYILAILNIIILMHLLLEY